eukprot:TRINITY_DN124507_c0_g1_i1.p1 TRINITY_DN124507_c0_g1~~TRINITY_DN124507_c0_g1_i1.p1  ORF type:complete len:200 (+),score=27.67 TRINITY_DN124507_c0_g1_i1:78-677(+)
MPMGTTTARSNGCVVVSQIWAVSFWIVLFADSIFNLFPNGLKPLKNRDLTPMQWFWYVFWCIGLLLGEGMGAFQKSFSPILIRRTRELTSSSSMCELILSPFFVAGLMTARPSRLLKSWILMAVLIPGLALTVPHLHYPYRECIDAGVVLGLSWGTGVVIVLAARAAFRGEWPKKDPELPVGRSSALSDTLPQAPLTEC